jgi:DNA-binding NarL/FixJ family response regulator
MVVEDDLVTRRIICHAIEREPSLMLCSAVGTVRDARRYLIQSPIDLLLADLGLPDGSGISVIRACRQYQPRADILVISMSSEEEQILACIEAGAVGYVLKESIQSNLMSAIVDLRSGGSPISPAIARKVLLRMRHGVSGRIGQLGSEPSCSLLTRRECLILDSISRGGSYAKVADAFGLSIGTVQTHIKHIYAKLGVHSRTEAIVEAQRRGLIPLQSLPT